MSFGDVLEKHGYDKTGGGPHAYMKGQVQLHLHESGKHAIRVHGNKWEHETQFLGTHAGGEGHESLDKHLSKYHKKSTQHTEQPTNYCEHLKQGGLPHTYKGPSSDQ